MEKILAAIAAANGVVLKQWWNSYDGCWELRICVPGSSR